MDIKFETWVPTHQARLVSEQDLPGVYRDVSGNSSPTFTWNDGGDQVLIVSVGDDYSTVTMLNDSTFSCLVVSDDDELREVDIAGQSSMIPSGAVLPRNVGLEVLARADDFNALIEEYSWKEQ